MKRRPVDFTSLKSVGYDAETETLEVELRNGRIYRYSEIPTDEYDGLLSAPSLGSYFNANIRDGYSHVRVR